MSEIIGITTDKQPLIKKLTAEYGCTEDKLENVLSKRI